MPKLDAEKAKKVAEQEGSEFEALPEGIYVVKLNKVDVRQSKKDPTGPGYWAWELEVVDGEFKGRRQWVNTSLKDTADWKMKEVFEAFGYTTDSDTDEIVGERCRIAVVQRVIEGGARDGQMGNDVEKCLPLGDAAAGEEDDEGF